jgi:hypothetical protein
MAVLREPRDSHELNLTLSWIKAPMSKDKVERLLDSGRGEPF